jgi:hypothetical protein
MEDGGFGLEFAEDEGLRFSHAAAVGAGVCADCGEERERKGDERDKAHFHVTLE